MSAWLSHFEQSLLTTCIGILPIAIIIIGFQLAVIRKPLARPKQILIGFMFVLFGIAFFLEGLDMALFPLGKLMASQLTTPSVLGAIDGQATAWQDYYWLYLFAASLGFASTLAEPSLIAVAQKTEQLSGGAIHALGLRLAIALGVALGIVLGVFKIVTGAPLYHYIIAGYAVIALQTLSAPKAIIALAYDAGGITTSTVTVPLVTAMGLGLAESLPGRSPLTDGFGLISFAILFPAITVLAYAQIAAWLSKHRPSPKA